MLYSRFPYCASSFFFSLVFLAFLVRSLTCYFPKENYVYTMRSPDVDDKIFAAYNRTGHRSLVGKSKIERGRCVCPCGCRLNIFWRPSRREIMLFCRGSMCRPPAVVHGRAKHENGLVGGGDKREGRAPVGGIQTGGGARNKSDLRGGRVGKRRR